MSKIYSFDYKLVTRRSNNFIPIICITLWNTREQIFNKINVR